MAGLPTRRSVNKDPHPDLKEAVTISRFWRNVDMQSDTKCWRWLGDTDKDGYGIFFYRGRKYPAHELARSFSIGEKRHPNLDTCHSCDNPTCCNPSHLRFDSRKSNVADMLNRHRSKNWDRATNKLTVEIVKEMRERRALGAAQKELASQYGISPAYVSAIVRGLTWKQAGGPIQEKRSMYRKVA